MSEFKEFCAKNFDFPLEDSKVVAEKVWRVQQAEIEQLNAQVTALCKYNGELEDFVGDMEDAGTRAASILDQGQKAMKEVASDE